LVEISKLSEAIFVMTVSTKDTIYGENILILFRNHCKLGWNVHWMGLYKMSVYLLINNPRSPPLQILTKDHIGKLAIIFLKN
jgi:hypothetical protein